MNRPLPSRSRSHGPTFRLGMLFGVVTLTAFLAAGCAESPNSSPMAPTVSESPAGTTTSPAATTAVVLPAPLIPVDLIKLIPAPLTGITLSRTARILAATGGQLTAGRHTLYFAPGSLKADTDITLADVSGKVGHLECELYPEGLNFKGDVRLFSSTAGLTTSQGWHVFWITKDSNGRKVGQDQGGEAWNAGTPGILVHLKHFCTYRAGKAGW